MNNYLKISSTGNISGGKQFRWVKDSYTVTSDVESTLQRTLQNTTVEQFGGGKRHWTFTAQFPHTGDATWAGKADILGWMEGSTAAQRKLKFQDVDGTVYTAHWASRPVLQPLENADYTAADSLWRAPMELVQE